MAVDIIARGIASGRVPITAYDMAVAGGYVGTKEEFEADMGNSGTNATNAANSADAAAASEAAALAAAGNLAPEFDENSNYNAGDYVLYEGGLYRFTANHPAGAWTGSDAALVTIASTLATVTYRELFDGMFIRVRPITNGTTLVDDQKARGYIFRTVPGCKYRISHTCGKTRGRLAVYYSSNGRNFLEDTNASIPTDNISSYNETTFTASYPYAFVLMYYGTETETRTFNFSILETYVNNFGEFKVGNVAVPTQKEYTGVVAKYVSDTMTAPANLSVGAFVLAAKTLYRVTENIASGGDIVPGSNVVATTIGEQLAALWAAVNS